jgi:hypothetical protein
VTAALAPNALQPCGTDAARKRHRAHGQCCETCWPGDGLPAVVPYAAPQIRAALRPVDVAWVDHWGRR